MTNAQKNGLLAGVAIVALGAASAIFYRSAGGGASVPATATIPGVCLSCKAESTIAVRLTEHDPYTCSKCMQRAFYPLYYCQDCRKRFVPTLGRSEIDGALRVPMSVTCSACSGGNVLPYDPETMGPEMVKGDQPLPKWEP